MYVHYFNVKHQSSPHWPHMDYGSAHTLHGFFFLNVTEVQHSVFLGSLLSLISKSAIWSTIWMVNNEKVIHIRYRFCPHITQFFVWILKYSTLFSFAHCSVWSLNLQYDIQFEWSIMKKVIHVRYRLVIFSIYNLNNVTVLPLDL